MTTGQAHEIERMWAEGVKTQLIAESVGLSSNTVRTYASRHRDQCPERPKGRPTSPERDRLAARMYHGGASRTEVAEALGVDKATVTRMVKRHMERSWS